MRNKIFEKIPIVVPDRSGFDLSHENRGTAKIGILVPVMTREMEGRDSLSVNLGAQIQFAPFATDFYGRVKASFEAFFVPYRIIDGSYKSLYRNALNSLQSGSTEGEYAQINPYFEGLIVYNLTTNGPAVDSDDPITKGDTKADPAPYEVTLDETMTADPSVGLVGPCTLLDYLGCKCEPIYDGSDYNNGSTPLYLNNRHRLDAYHRIYEEYYMDSRIQNWCYGRYRSGDVSADNDKMSQIINHRATPYNGGNKFYLIDGPLLDGTYVTGLHARNYAKDYFTTATPDPQFGGEVGVMADETGRISISQIRVGNALQQFVELHNRIGRHYDDLAFALTGIRPSDAAVDIPVYLGRQVYDVYLKSVFQNNNSGGDVAVGFPNPFESVGSKFANGQALGSGHLCDFTATEGGIFMVIMSVYPDASYGTGNARQWDYSTIFDLPHPQLQGIGDQPIYKGELTNSLVSAGSAGFLRFELFDHDAVFGYTQRYAEAKFMLDETHGLLRDYQSLSAFALKRSFDLASDVELGLDFIKVPTNALDEVSALNTSDGGNKPFNPQSEFGYWFDLYFDVKLVSNLSAYSIPTLENMKGNTVMVDNGGRRL